MARSQHKKRLKITAPPATHYGRVASLSVRATRLSRQRLSAISPSLQQPFFPPPMRHAGRGRSHDSAAVAPCWTRGSQTRAQRPQRSEPAADNSAKRLGGSRVDTQAGPRFAEHMECRGTCANGPFRRSVRPHRTDGHGLRQPIAARDVHPRSVRGSAFRGGVVRSRGEKQHVIVASYAKIARAAARSVHFAAAGWHAGTHVRSRDWLLGGVTGVFYTLALIGARGRDEILWP